MSGFVRIAERQTLVFAELKGLVVLDKIDIALRHARGSLHRKWESRGVFFR